MLGEDEKWIVGYEGQYSVSTSGEVFSYRGSKKPLKQAFLANKKGDLVGRYKTVCLSVDNVQKNYYVHRLVALTFTNESFDSKLCVNHKNGIKEDNRLENLELVSYSENMTHAYDTGLLVRVKDQEDFDREVSLYLETGKSKYSEKTIKKHWKEEHFNKLQIPFELSRCSITTTSHKAQWDYICKIFSFLESEMTLTDIAKIVGIDLSLISRIKSGERFKFQKKIYDKYKNDKYYNKYLCQ